MQLTILGSGTAIPWRDRFPAGYYLEHEGTRLMVDCGPGTLRRLVQAGGDLATLDAVLLTHYHTDHCADVAALLFALRAPRYDGRGPLRLFGAPGLRRLVATLTEAWPWLAPRGYELELVEFAGREPGSHAPVAIGSFEGAAIPIRHTAASLGYRLRTDAGTIALSGDADECDALVDLARDVDLFVCDCAAPDGAKLDGHLTPSLAGRYAAAAGARTLILTHFYPECEGHDLGGMAASVFGGRVILAEDLMALTVGLPD